jgi:iron(III) transport system ATP-binding protein
MSSPDVSFDAGKMSQTRIPPDHRRIATEPYLRIKNVRKLFGDHVVLNDVSLDVHESEFICFLGPSGCGKTTLLRAIAGLDLQTQGTIEQAGKDISRLPPSRRDFGIVFQSYALFPNLTVAQNIGYGLRAVGKGRAEIAARVDEMLRLVGLLDHASKYPSRLSGGQQQRVAVARALATSPGLLLLDEPFSALDAQVRVHLRNQLKLLQQQLGVTTIMVTHDQEEALTMADRVVVMNHGVIEQVGTAQEVYTQPATPFVAGFIGMMASLSGTVLDRHTVQVGNLCLTCDREFDPATVGEPVTLCIRPEDVVIRNAELGRVNSVMATIANLEFVGSFYRVTLQLDGQDKIEVPATCSVNAVRELKLSVGARIPVSLEPERLRIFPSAP